MAKGKRKGGLSGVARFVFDSMKSNTANLDDAQNTSSPNNANPDLIPEAQMKILEIKAEEMQKGTSSANRPTKRRRKNDGTAAVAAVPEYEAGQLSSVDRWVQKYDASGLVPHYTHASQVPEHLQKCT